MKTRMNINMPDVGEITAGLEPEQDRGAIKAARHLAEAEEAMQEAGEHLRRCTSKAREIREQAPRGEASMADLETALTAEQAAALAVPGHEQQIAEARQRLQEAQHKAREAVVAEARHRVATLQAVADKVVPTLEALRAAEEALQARISTACAFTSAQGIPTRGPNLPALRWPSTLEDDAMFFTSTGQPRPAELDLMKDHHQRRRSA